MIKLFLIIGPQAVGKMSLGELLSKKYEWVFVHNHLIIDLITQMHSYASLEWYEERLNLMSRCIEVAVSKNKSICLTRTYNFNNELDVEEFKGIKYISSILGIKVEVIELSAALDLRVERNKCLYRLSRKPSKSDIQLSERRLIETSNRYLYSAPNTLREGIKYHFFENHFNCKFKALNFLINDIFK